MYTELTEKERKSILGNENFKGTFVCADSPVCHYCARYHFPDYEFEDNEKCMECIHNQESYYLGYDSENYEDNFLGIECVTWKEDEDER